MTGRRCERCGHVTPAVTSPAADWLIMNWPLWHPTTSSNSANTAEFPDTIQAALTFLGVDTTTPTPRP